MKKLKKMRKPRRLSDDIQVDSEFNLNAVSEYYNSCPGSKPGNFKNLILNAKKHLSSIGWSFFYAWKTEYRKELRYRSPSGKVYYSLKTACKAVIDQLQMSSDHGRGRDCADNVVEFDGFFGESGGRVAKKANNVVDLDGFVEEISGSVPKKQGRKRKGKGKGKGKGRDEFLSNLKRKRVGGDSCCDINPYVVKIDGCVGEISGSVPEKRGRIIKKRGNVLSTPIRKTVGEHSYQAPDPKIVNFDGFNFDDFLPNGSLPDKNGELSSNMGRKEVNETGQIQDPNVVKSDDFVPQVNGFLSDQQWKKRKKKGKSLRKMVGKKVRKGSCNGRARTMLAMLIEKNVVLPGETVYYRNKRDGSRMAEGRVTSTGIECNCCGEIFTLSKFEAHAGSTNHRPSKNIFLEDGRSLFDCQLQLKRETSLTELRTRSSSMDQVDCIVNDDICSVCCDGGELVLCDSCPSSFHWTCLGSKEVPGGETWFCPSCCCGICGQGQVSELNKHIKCEQCEHLFHVECLRKKGMETCKNWLCSKICKKIFSGLQRILGKQVQLGVDNLTWTLMKFDINGSDVEEVTENYTKLKVSLGVMHECFEPMKDPRTGRDVVEDVIFSRFSELKRLNYKGFYTVVLERKDEVITVATVRVYGGKVAEFPLVATRFKYRRRGMCRVLMNELEKKLGDLGVERLVLPAVPSVVNTWTGAFGFSAMTASERLGLSDCTFLEFPGTIMCQKILRKLDFPSIESISGDGTSHASDASSIFSEVLFESD